MRNTLFSLMILAARLEAQTGNFREDAAGGADLWPTMIVLVVSFLLGVISFLAVDRLLKDEVVERKPGADAYIDQMIAVNGVHLKLKRRNTVWTD